MAQDHVRRTRRKRDNVLSLRGAVPAHGVPEKDVCDKLRKLLVEAEAGAISGVVIGWIGPSHTILTGWYGRADSHELIAAAGQLHARVMAAWLATAE